MVILVSTLFDYLSFFHVFEEKNGTTHDLSKEELLMPTCTHLILTCTYLILFHENSKISIFLSNIKKKNGTSHFATEKS